MGDELEHENTPSQKVKRSDDLVEHDRQVMLFLEEICCDLCKYRHVVEENYPADLVKVHREVQITSESERFGDIRVYVKSNDEPISYFLEVDYGYQLEKIIGTITYKYGLDNNIDPLCTKLVILTSKLDKDESVTLEDKISAVLNPGLTIEIWDETQFIGMIDFSLPIGRNGFADFYQGFGAIDSVPHIVAVLDRHAENAHDLIADELIEHPA